MPGLQAIRRFQTGGSTNPYNVSADQLGLFNALVASGTPQGYAQAAAMAEAAGIPASVVTDYINQNRAGLNLSAPVSTEQVQSFYPSSMGPVLTNVGATNVDATNVDTTNTDTNISNAQADFDRLIDSLGIRNVTADSNLTIDGSGGPTITGNVTSPIVQSGPYVGGSTTDFVGPVLTDFSRVPPPPTDDLKIITDQNDGVRFTNVPTADFLASVQREADLVAASNALLAAGNQAAAQEAARRAAAEEAARIAAEDAARRAAEGSAIQPLQPTAQQGLRSIPQTAILRSPMAMPDLLAQPATRPQLSSGIRALDLGTQTFGDLTNLQRGAPIAADQMPSTAIAGQVNPLRSYIDSLYAAGADDATVAAFGERAGLNPRAFAELFRDVPGTTAGTIQSFYNQLRPQGIYSTVTPNALQSQVNVPARSFAPPMGDEAIVFRGLPEADQIAAIHNYRRANPNVSPEQLVTDMTRFGVTADLLSRAGPPPPLNANTPTANTPATNPALLGPGLEGYVYSASGGRVSLAEGGMPKLSAKEAGSQFDVSEYIDPETGRFYINEYQRDVLFNPELREAERVARERMTPEEEARAIRNMQIRMGLTAPIPQGITSTGRPVPSGTFDPYQYGRGYELASGGVIDVIPSKVYSARVPIQLGTPSYAKGGLASIAENLAEKGRGGDTMLVHMSPEEVQGINALTQRMTGRSLTINPKTGLPEAFLAAFLPALLGFAGTKVLGLTALQSAMLVGAGYAVKYKSLKRGLSAGLGAFGGAQLGAGLEAAGAAATQGPPIVPQGVAEAGTGAVSPDFGGITIAQGPQVTGGYGNFAPVVTDPTPDASYAAGNVAARTAEQAALAPASTLERLGAGASDLLSSDEATRQAAQTAYKGATDSTPFMAVSQVLGGASMDSAVKEQDAFKAAQAAKDREEEERRRQYAELASRIMPYGAGGGLVAMAQGGMPTFEYGGTTAPTGEPRMVKGAGDGMSDNVPANIEGVQEARLANDEFVIPADVVADIGNGSSSAGAKKLYAMMDRIRQARHGTTEQPPEIKAERLMPA